MKNSTHYYFAVAIILVDIVLFNPLSMFEKLFTLPFVILAGYVALVPNKLERWLCIDRKTHTCTERCRHPLTHHPIIVFILLWLFSLISITPQYVSMYQLLTRIILLAYGSHLVLDVLTPEGLPLGRTPTLFYQDHTKNYTFNITTKSRKRLRFFHGAFSRDNSNINHKITLASKLIVLLYCFMLILEINRNLEILATIDQFLTHLNGWVTLCQREGIEWF
jgi:hypothetical protein